MAQDTDLNSYEKRSVITFMVLYMGGILLLFSFILLWYHQKETRRIVQEERIALKLYSSQCARLKRFAPESFNCSIEKPDLGEQYRKLYYEIAMTLAGVLLFGLILSYYLAKLSLRPMHEAYKLMDGFVHAMIHDLNTPISTAQLNAEALLQSDLTQKQLTRVGRIEKSLDKLAALQKQLRTSIDNTAFTYREDRFRLDTMLHTFSEYSEFITVTCANHLTVTADEMMIERMIENIVTNAIKYNRGSNQITITLDKTVLTISDHGRGIKNTDRIFERYYRENSSLTGLGLGLGIVKMVSDHYGLGVEIKSRLNTGTTVTLDFSPVATP